MTTYRVEVTEWTISGYLEIEADSPQEASERVSDGGPLSDAEWRSLEITAAVEYGFPEPSMVTDLETGIEYDGDGEEYDDDDDDDDEEE